MPSVGKGENIWLLLFDNFKHVWQQAQVSTSTGSTGNDEAALAEKSDLSTEETPNADKNEEEMTLGDALNQIKETSLASVEELHNLAGGSDIKVYISYIVLLLFYPCASLCWQW